MSVETLMARLDEASDAFVLPDVLQPLDIFVELAGEEFRKRLFATEGADGRALCLRPDFTIPVSLAHLRSGAAAPAIYHYRGKIFRKQRRIGAPEFEQAGTEWIGHEDDVAADAAVFALASECARDIGLTPQVRVGDANVFVALTQALGLPASWRQRLGAAFGDAERLAATMARLTRKDADGLAAQLAPALAKVNAAQARAIVDAVVGLPRHAATPGRSRADIAERILEQAAENGGDAAMLSVVERFCALSSPLTAAAETLTAFAKAEAIDLSAAIDAFVRRTDALRASGVATDGISYQAGFGRRLNYYTGFVFEMVNPREPRAEVIAGGRYDTLMTLLDRGRAQRAIGFSVWLDRVPEAA